MGETDSMAAGVESAWVLRVLGVDVVGLDTGLHDPRNDEPAITVELPALDAMTGWMVARASAVASLQSLEQAFRDSGDPDADVGIILLRAVRANLTPEPAEARQVAELEAYLGTDDIIAEAEVPNGFGVEVSLRVPLLAALARLRADQGGDRA